MKTKLLLLSLLLGSNMAFAQYLPSNNKPQQVPQLAPQVTTQNKQPVNQPVVAQQNQLDLSKYSVAKTQELPEMCKKPKPCDTCQPERVVYDQICTEKKLSEVNQIISWWGKQPNTSGKGTMNEAWAKQGIKDPQNNPDLIVLAQKLLDNSNKKIEDAIKSGKRIDPKEYKPWVMDGLNAINATIDAQIAKKIEEEKKARRPVNPMNMVLETKGNTTIIKEPPNFDMRKALQPPTPSQPR